MGLDRVVRNRVIFVCLALCSISLAQYGGGSGSSDDPYLIFTGSQLNEIGTKPDDLRCHFKLMADLDLSDLGGAQWNIIGTMSKPFAGVFDGNGHTISNLSCASDAIEYVGLFGYAGYSYPQTTIVMNLGLIDVSVQGDYCVGGLVARICGRVLNCYVTGSVSSNRYYAGGLIGHNDGAVTNCYALVQTSGGRYAGGLIGLNRGMLTNSYSGGMVSGTQYVGGLVAYGVAPVNSFWDMEASGLSIGGSGGGRTADQMKLPGTYIGWNLEDQAVWVLDSGRDYPRLAWEGKPGEAIAPVDLGDLLTGSGSETDPYLVATSGQFNAIGLFPSEWGKHFRLTSDIDLSQEPGLQWNMIGVSESDAFVGLFDGQSHTVSGLAYDSPSFVGLGLFGCVGRHGHVTGLNVKDANIVGGWCVGGLVGWLLGGVSDCSVTGVVAGYTDIGGLVGTNQGDIEDCRCDVIVSGDMIGGLVGANCGGDIKRSSAAGVVVGTGALGGLAGFNVSNGTISECTAEAAVSSTYAEELPTLLYGQAVSVSGFSVVRVSVYRLASFVGGLVGLSDEEISDCYATGSVSGTHAVGGLVGYNAGPITRCYSTGSVSDGPAAGGLVGGSGRNHRVEASFWDAQASEVTSSLGGLGRTTDQMRQASTYWGWNDEDRVLWRIDDGHACPTLSWEAGAGEPIPDLDALLAGSGTEEDPYQIATAQDLIAVSLFPSRLDKCFQVMADLDLSSGIDRPFNGIGVREEKCFDGQFDGQGHSLRGLVIDASSSEQVGLFGLVGSKAVVKDFHLIDCSVVAASEVGALVGCNYGTISGCSMTGTVAGLDRVGGLVGSNQGGISVCCAAGTVTGREFVGGLVGYTTNSSKVSDSYAQGPISGTERVGGLIGRNSGVVTTCYATGATAGVESVGGLTGTNDGTVLVSYWDIDMSGQPDSAAGEGLPTAQMKQAATYFGWNAGAQQNWLIDEGIDYPRLAWEGRGGQWILPLGLSEVLAGDGTEDNPYIIETADQIAAIGLIPSQWTSHFALAADIDLSACPTAGLNPIGASQAVSFNGLFDGKGHQIINLTMHLPTTDSVGLFGWIGSKGCVKNLEMVNVDIAGDSSVGALAGYCAGNVEDCSVTGSVAGRQYVGGLVGYSAGRITRCTAWTIVTADYYAAGCLLGRNYGGTVSQSSARGMAISTTGAGDMGGLVGSNEGGRISFCFANATVSGDGSDDFGGLVGSNESGGRVYRCYAHGFVEGGYAVGGLVGGGWGSTVYECYATSLVIGTDLTGGLVGYGDPEDVSRSFWDIQRSGQSDSAGGQALDSASMQDPRTYMAAGWDFAFADDGGSDIWSMPEPGGYPMLWWEMDPVPALPAFDAGSGTFADPYLLFDVGGFNRIGHNPRLMDKAFKLQADLEVSDVKMDPVGDKCSPFAGTFDGAGHTISGLMIDANGLDYAGLFPYVESRGVIRNLGLMNVTLLGKDYVGGLAGYNKGTLTGCCVTGLVSGNQCVGGVVGYTLGTVVDSYSAASIAGQEDVGGLAGGAWGRIERCYAVGLVSGSEDVGGFGGGSVWTPTSSTSFWDMETTGQSKSHGGLGKTTAEMENIETFQSVGWDFCGQEDGSNDVWALPRDGGYPILWWQVDPLPALPIFAGGSGVLDDPFLLADGSDLSGIWANPRLMDKSFRVTRQIDLMSIPFASIGDRDTPFNGVFDGAGFFISGLWLEEPDRDYLGLFGRIGPGGRVQDVDLDGVYVSGHDYVGALAGQNDGTVETCSVSGTVTGRSTVGGLIGWNRFGTISDCDSAALVSSLYGPDGLVVGSDQGEDTPSSTVSRR